jgi:glycosyltransferase involved in cell wall biosynthesis
MTFNGNSQSNAVASTSLLQPVGVSVVIPCLNEESTIEKVIQESFLGLSLCGVVGEVIVADNGSNDQSRDIALKHGARVVRVSQRGYGSALHSGILAAQYSVVVFADGDLSYPLKDMRRLTEPVLADEADFVLGSRLNGHIHKGAMPFLNRVLGTKALSYLIYLLYGLKTSDCNSGMRAFRRSNYLKLDLRMIGMEYASEMLVRVQQCKLRYKEVPIEYRKDQRGHASHLRPLRDGLRHLKLLLNLTHYL